MKAVLWILNTDAQWLGFREVLRVRLTQLANMLCDEGAIDERGAFHDLQPSSVECHTDTVLFRARWARPIFARISSTVATQVNTRGRMLC